METGTTRDSERLFWELYDQVIETIHSGIDPRLGFQQFVDECRRVAPDPVWDVIARLDIPADLDHLDRWLRFVIEKEPPPPNINGLWFGISDPFVDEKGGLIGYELYICGSNQYDPADSSFDWAADAPYWPTDLYSHSEVFHALGRIPEEGLPYKLASIALPLLYAGLVVDWLAGRMPAPLRGSATSRAIGVGHDEGDGVLVGFVDSAGYHRSR